MEKKLTIDQIIAAERDEWTSAARNWNAVHALETYGYVVVLGPMALVRADGLLKPGYPKCGQSGPIRAALFSKEEAEWLAAAATLQCGEEWTAIHYRKWPVKRLAEVEAMSQILTA